MEKFRHVVKRCVCVCVCVVCDCVCDCVCVITFFSHQNICVLNAEEKFLPQLEKIHHKFPKLRIVLEHVTTAAAVAMVCRHNTQREVGERV